MHGIVIATADQGFGSRTSTRLSTHGYATRLCSSWVEALTHAARGSASLLLIDSRLPGASGSLLHELAAALPDAPKVACLRGDLPPLERVTLEGLLELAQRTAPTLLDPYEQRVLEYAGLGTRPLDALRAAAASPLPVLLEGERGTGKETMARLLHRLSGQPGPFVEQGPSTPITLHGTTPGTVYLHSAEVATPDRIDELTAFTQATGWKLVAGTRTAPDSRTSAWSQLRLRPLRERPRDIRPLGRLYLGRWAERLNLPPRRIHHVLWKLIEQYDWPGNQRQLETFIVQAATSSRGAMISRGSLPPSLVAGLDTESREREEARAFEEMAQERLRPLVGRHADDPDGTLHRVVLDAMERALYRLALQQTGWNQKATARLLGVARNTLRTRMERLDLVEEPR